HRRHAGRLAAAPAAALRQPVRGAVGAAHRRVAGGPRLGRRRLLVGADQGGVGPQRARRRVRVPRQPGADAVAPDRPPPGQRDHRTAYLTRPSPTTTLNGRPCGPHLSARRPQPPSTEGPAGRTFLPVAPHHPQRKALRAAPFCPSPATTLNRAPAGRSLFYPSSTALDGGRFESLARLASPATWGFGASEGRQGAEGNMGPDAAGRDQGSAGRAPRRPVVSGKGSGEMSLEEAQRQLEAAIHDARVSFDCIALDDLERSHTNAITARAAVDAAEYAIRVALEERRKAEEAEESEEAKGAG